MNKETNPCRTYIVWNDGLRTSIADYAKATAEGKATPCASASAKHTEDDKARRNAGWDRLADYINELQRRERELTKKREDIAKLHEINKRNPHPVNSRDWHMFEAKRRGDAFRDALGYWGLLDGGYTGGETSKGTAAVVGDGSFPGRPPRVKAETVTVSDEKARAASDFAAARRVDVDGMTVKDNTAQRVDNGDVAKANIRLTVDGVELRDTSKARGFTPEQNNKGEAVIHGLVTYHFVDGKMVELDNVTRVVMSGTWMRVWSDIGLTIIDVAKLTHSTSYQKNTGGLTSVITPILEKSRKVHFVNGKQFNVRNVTALDVLHPDFWVITHSEGVTNVYTSKVNAVTVGV